MLSFTSTDKDNKFIPWPKDDRKLLQQLEAAGCNPSVVTVTLNGVVYPSVLCYAQKPITLPNKL